MKFQELEARAKPGPLIVDCDPGFWLYLCVADAARKNGNRVIATFQDSSDEQIASVRLLAHCRNNFGKALAALKRQVVMCDECGERPATRWYLDTNPDQERNFCDDCKRYPTDGANEENIALVNLIAELEEVQDV